MQSSFDAELTVASTVCVRRDSRWYGHDAIQLNDVAIRGATVVNPMANIMLASGNKRWSIASSDSTGPKSLTVKSGNTFAGSSFPSANFVSDIRAYLYSTY